MAKTKISEYSSTASNNTDVDGINIAEGMAPSNVNNAMREIMAQLKDWQSGAVSQDMYVNGAFTASGNAVLSADLSVGDDLTVTGDASVGGAFTCTGAAVLSSSLAVTGNATIGGTLSAGSTSLGAATFSGAVIMSSTLAANGNVTVGTSTTNSHTFNGNLTVGTSTSNTVTLNTLLSAGGGTGTSGQVLKSRGTSNTPEWGAAESVTLLGTIATTTGATQTLSVNLTSYKFLKLFVSRVSHDSGTSRSLRFNSISGPQFSTTASSGNYAYGSVDIDLSSNGTFGASVHWNTTSGVSGESTGAYGGESGITTASTSVTIAISGGSFDGGNVYVYGIK